MPGPTPRPDDWKGGSEDFGFLRTFDGHIAVDLFATSDEEGRFGRRNTRKSFESADLEGEYDPRQDG